jgi:hypothetical protein
LLRGAFEDAVEGRRLLDLAALVLRQGVDAFGEEDLEVLLQGWDVDSQGLQSLRGARVG